MNLESLNTFSRGGGALHPAAGLRRRGGGVAGRCEHLQGPPAGGLRGRGRVLKITARNMSVLTTPGAEKLELYAFKWALVRLSCYGAAISLAWTFDRATYHGLIATVLGILLVQVVMIGYGLLRRGGSAG